MQEPNSQVVFRKQTSRPSNTTKFIKTTANFSLPRKSKGPISKRILKFFKSYGHYVALGVTVAFCCVATCLPFFTEKYTDTPVLNPRLQMLILNQKNSFNVYAGQAFKGWTNKDVRSTFGNVLWSNDIDRIEECQNNRTKKFLPESFDARNEWPTCFHESFPPTKCSASWAVSIAEMLTSRLCKLHPESLSDIRFSPQDLLSCDEYNQGCVSGSLDMALNHVLENGIVSLNCFPYSNDPESVLCSEKCKERPFVIESYCRATGVKAIKNEIMQNGPVSAIMILYDDFFLYGGGRPYRNSKISSKLYTIDSQVMTHAVTLLGWGVENGSPYWIIQTNFGPDWGENGYAKVIIKENLVLDQFVVAGKFKILKPQYKVSPSTTIEANTTTPTAE